MKKRIKKKITKKISNVEFDESWVSTHRNNLRFMSCVCNILNRYPILTTQGKTRAWPKQHVQIKMLERLSILYRCKINK